MKEMQLRNPRRASLITKTAGVLNVMRCEPGGQMPGQVLVGGGGVVHAQPAVTVVQMQGGTHYPPVGGY